MNRAFFLFAEDRSLVYRLSHTFWAVIWKPFPYLLEASSMKEVLISYITRPLTHPHENPLQFSNPGIARCMAKVLDQDYLYDVVDWNNTEFCSLKKYDLFIGHGGAN